MAEQQGADAATQPLSNGADDRAQIGVLSQYVKDLSFENPNAPAVFQWQKQPNFDVQFNLGAQQVGDDLHEAVLRIDVSAKTDEGVAFKVELLYGGLFAIRNLPADQLQPFLLAEAPRILFPFARRVIADAVIDGGFPPLMLDPIDFGALYQQQQQAQQQAGAGQAGDAIGQA